MSLTVYLSITDSFFLWGSQSKRLIYVDAIFVSRSYILWASWPGLFQQNRWQLHNFLFPWTDEYRFLEPQMTICVFSTNDHSIVCYHARFVFVGTFKKSVTIPATILYVIYSLWILSWSFPPINPSGAFANFFSVTSTCCRSYHYRIFRKLCLQKATLKVQQSPLLHHFAIAHTHF